MSAVGDEVINGNQQPVGLSECRHVAGFADRSDRAGQPSTERRIELQTHQGVTLAFQPDHSTADLNANDTLLFSSSCTRRCVWDEDHKE